MQSQLILNVLALALAASFAGSAVAQDSDTLTVPPVERINPTPPVNPESTRQGVDPLTGQPYTAIDRMHDANDGKDKDLAEKDWSELSPTHFVEKALKSGRKEVESARMAQQRSSDPRVREFAQTLERDHSQLNVRLEALNLSDAPASASDGLDQGDRPVGMRAAGDMTHEDGKDKMHKLSDLQGAAFDRHYVTIQVKMHDKSIAMYQAASTQGDNTEVKALARDALPTLRSHAELAKSLQMSLSVD